jgi:hypothetical protein
MPYAVARWAAPVSAERDGDERAAEPVGEEVRDADREAEGHQGQHEADADEQQHPGARYAVAGSLLLARAGLQRVDATVSASSMAEKSSRTVTRGASATRRRVSRLAPSPASSRWTVRTPTPLSVARRSWVQPCA